MTLEFRPSVLAHTNPIPSRPVAIRGVLAVGDMAILTGGWDTFKSHLSMELAWSLATGRSFLGHFPVVTPLRTGIVQVEIDPGSYDERLRQFTPSDDLLVASDLTFRLDRLEELYEAVREHRLEALVLDPVGPMWPDRAETGEVFDENKKTHVTRLLRNLRSVGTTTILVHHDPKPSQGFRSRASGSSALLNEPDTRILVDRNAADSIQLEVRSRLQSSLGGVNVRFTGARRLVAQVAPPKV